MIANREWLWLVTLSGLYWQESGENPLVFCYRIGWTLLATLHDR